jgi:dCMP deaminase
MKTKLINAYMKTAKTFAECSTARRLHVGAIVVKDDRIISIGYNGMPSGWDNNCEDEIRWPNGEIRFLETKPEVLHAERNALDKLARGNEGGLGATMFITHSPCLECAKSIYGAGISRVFYGEQYRSVDGIEFLKKCNVDVEQVDV